MTYEHKMGYLELKRAIESTKEEMKNLELTLQLDKVMLEGFEKAILDYPAPKLNPLTGK